MERTEPADWKEKRRMRAFELKKKGWKQTDIAEALGVTDGAVSQWMSRAEEGGKEALRRKVDTGPDKRLSDEDRQKLPALLKKGPEHYGFRGQVWTRERVGKVIEREFGVSYHKTQVGRILDQIGWSLPKRTLPKPAERASERDEEAIETWRTERWEELKKAETESRTIVFIDKAGFYMLPNSVRTYAPRGETPVIEGSASRDRVSAISAITPAGRLLTSMQEEAFDRHDIVDFLWPLLRHIEGKVRVIWDGLPAHRSQCVLALRVSARLLMLMMCSMMLSFTKASLLQKSLRKYFLG